jgi:hypothetical protein
LSALFYIQNQQVGFRFAEIAGWQVGFCCAEIAGWRVSFSCADIAGWQLVGANKKMGWIARKSDPAR